MVAAVVAFWRFFFRDFSRLWPGLFSWQESSRNLRIGAFVSFNHFWLSSYFFLWISSENQVNRVLLSVYDVQWSTVCLGGHPLRILLINSSLKLLVTLIAFLFHLRIIRWQAQMHLFLSFVFSSPLKKTKSRLAAQVHRGSRKPENLTGHLPHDVRHTLSKLVRKGL